MTPNQTKTTPHRDINPVRQQSEPKAILANELAEAMVDSDGLRELLTLVKTPGHAIWAGMAEVKPGTVLTVDRNGISEHTYWSLQASPHTDDIRTTVAHIRELLDDTVARQLVADVPHCLLLSGGLDSSALTALAGQQLDRHGQTVRSFAVDFVGQTDNFMPDEMRGETPDTPYAHEVAQHVGTDHQDIVLDHLALADPEIRKAIVNARDLPVGLGDIDNSLYLLFKTIREHYTVVLSGESADEIFGGYKWFHDPQVQQADTFPWMFYARGNGPMGALASGFATQLDLASYIRDRYADAVAEAPTLDGESEHERRMRIICYLHLTRMMRVLLDRKDRISMAVGLEVRVPFCDHRLVQYVFNSPWVHKTFDGREKSLLRAAVADLLPRSVLERKKSPYPSMQDQQYVALLQKQVAELQSTSNSWALEIFDGEKVCQAVTLPPAEITPQLRAVLERILNLQTWLDLRQPSLKMT